MAGMTLWNTLGAIAIFLLLISFSIGKKAIWSGFALGLLICIGIGVAAVFKGLPFLNLFLYQKIMTVMILAGGAFEIMTRSFKVSMRSRSTGI